MEKHLIDERHTLFEQDNTPVKHQSSAHVKSDGTLVIDSFQISDIGLYSSPDHKPIEHKSPDGTTSSVLPGHIDLVLKE
ncbi:hypothetical protein TELCIR_14039 [Teladorsagia circumcincta]|uniref:Uncharacterized protein n=1 Tax=Teladorsagia circumcincta TaxID=45464 RepID=A0A2G9U2G8_TELCI|nr:hypothetical protein TELCIR_14039 [Teladorsagia circumcincta]